MMGDVVELRVHGVSGTAPENLLDCPLVTQVAGDRKAGFYEPRLPEERHDPRTGPDGQPTTAGPRLEGYAWGGLTSGAPSRALWLLLLPFTLTNVAPRLRPAGPKLAAGRPQVNLWLLWFVSRLLALSMTVLIITALAGVSEDLFAWQCRTGPGSAPNCSAASPGWIMRPLLGLSLEHRLAVGAVVPLAILALLWQLSGRTINNYEGIPIHFWTTLKVRADQPPGADAIETPLQSPWMWHNEYQVRRLRYLHLQAGLATTLWVVSYPFGGTWKSLRVLVTIALAGYLVTMLCVPAYTGRNQHRSFARLNLAVWGVLVASAAGIGAALLEHHPLAKTAPDQGLPGYAGTALSIFLVQLGLFIVFACSIAVMSWRGWGAQDPLAPRSLRNCSAILLATMGLFLGAVFSSGTYVFAAAWFTTGSLKPGFRQVSIAAGQFDVPTVIRDSNRAYAVSLALQAIAVVAVVAWFAGNRVLRLLHLRLNPSSPYTTRLSAAYGAAAVTSDKARAEQVGKTFWLARQVDFAHRYLSAMIAMAAVVVVFFTVLLITSTNDSTSSNCLVRWHNYTRAGTTVSCGGPFGVHARIHDGFLSAPSLQGTGAYLAVLTLVLLVGLGAAAFRVPSTRRSVGILWDLASFWPRSAHPFAAPCYAERAVPDLTTRMYWRIREKTPRQGVVLAAHSQGTVISTAAMFQLAARDEAEAAHTASGSPRQPMLASVAFLSFGCVLRRLYARYFPAYFSTAALEHLRDLLTVGAGAPRWKNLWRDSDYLGGQVTAGPPPVHGTATDGVAQPDPLIEVQCTDPRWARDGGDTSWPKAAMHSDYWHDPVFGQTVGVLAATIPAVIPQPKAP